MKPLGQLAAAALAAIALVVVAREVMVSAAPDATAAAGYDHLWHEGRVSVGLAPEIPCIRCHDMDAAGRVKGRPDHRACYGDCHGPPPPPRRPGRRYTIAENQRRTCVICHAAAALDSAEAGARIPVAVAYPPYQHDPDHGLALSHAAHANARDARGKPIDCTLCHAMPGSAAGKPARGHASCTGCHAAAARTGSARAPANNPDPPGTAGSPRPPGMDQCLRCHVRAYGPRTRPYLVRGPMPVIFSHPDHAARGATDCRICHQAVVESADTELPAPTMASCQTCHNGSAAFSALGPHCRRCHTAPEAGTELRPPLQAGYDHDRHRARLGDTTCTRCHTIDAQGVPAAPAADHAPCSDAGCHRDEFAALEPSICGACHVGFEPWRPLHFDRPPPAGTQFGARFSHRAHLVDRGMKRGCEDCHSRASQRRDLRLPRDHSACTGSACHARDGGAAPGLDACQDCHVADLSEQRDRARKQAPWTVRGQFRHRPHQRDPGTGSPVACVRCHAGAERAVSIHDMPTPAKQTCIACHDGEGAFKITGHGCARCHGGVSP